MLRGLVSVSAVARVVTISYPVGQMSSPLQVASTFLVSSLPSLFCPPLHSSMAYYPLSTLSSSRCGHLSYHLYRRDR